MNKRISSFTVLLTLLTLILSICTITMEAQSIGGGIFGVKHLKLNAGTAAAPSLSFSTDPDTGIFLSGANSLGFVTNGVEKWVINASGNFNPLLDNTYGIGTSAVRVGGIYNGSGVTMGYVAQTATYTATSNDYTIAVTPAAATVINLPAAASHTGRVYVVRKMDASASTVTLDPNAAETVNGAATYVVPNTTSVTIQSTGAAWIILSVS